MSSTSIDDFPAIQEIMLEFHAGKMFFEGKRVVPDTWKGLIRIARGSHGFMKTHKWHDTIGAFINVEASGTRGPDLVCQFGPSSWPSNIYAEAAIYPMANSAAQDVFPVVPGK